MHIVCGRVRLSLLALLLVCVMDAEASFVSKVTGVDGNELVDAEGGAFGECRQAPEAGADDSQEEGSDGAEEASAGEDYGRDCSIEEEEIDPDADYN